MAMLSRVMRRRKSRTRWKRRSGMLCGVLVRLVAYPSPLAFQILSLSAASLSHKGEGKHEHRSRYITTAHAMCCEIPFALEAKHNRPLSPCGRGVQHSLFNSGKQQVRGSHHKRIVERIAGGAHCADGIARVVGVERLAQASDMDVDRARLDIDIRAPHGIEQLLAAE